LLSRGTHLSKAPLFPGDSMLGCQDKQGEWGTHLLHPLHPVALAVLLLAPWLEAAGVVWVLQADDHTGLCGGCVAIGGLPHAFLMHGPGCVHTPASKGGTPTRCEPLVCINELSVLRDKDNHKFRATHPPPVCNQPPHSTWGPKHNSRLGDTPTPTCHASPASPVLCPWSPQWPRPPLVSPPSGLGQQGQLGLGGPGHGVGQLLLEPLLPGEHLRELVGPVLVS
jgi:hypothetical protein